MGRTLREPQRVILTNRMPQDRLEVGDVGTIVHVCRDGSAYEVEFTMLDGRTAAVVTVEASDLRPVGRKRDHSRAHGRELRPVLHDGISVEAIGAHRLRIQFDDGVDGVLDVSRLVTMSGVFEPLRELAIFRQVQVHPELKVVCWPNGADLDSELLYVKLAGNRG